MTTLETIGKYKLVAICRSVTAGDIPALCDALIKGGIHLVEVTFDHTSEEGMHNTLECIKAIQSGYADKLCVGAGTVLSASEVEQAAQAGANYIISPNVNINVISKTKELGLVSIPGAMTPTEAEMAVESGADLVKLFPAAALGIAYFKAIISPLKHIKFVPTGGITPENVPEFMKLGAVGFGIGGNLINAKQVKEGRFDVIEESARAFVAAAGL